LITSRTGDDPAPSLACFHINPILKPATCINTHKNDGFSRFRITPLGLFSAVMAMHHQEQEEEQEEEKEEEEEEQGEGSSSGCHRSLSSSGGTKRPFEKLSANGYGDAGSREEKRRKRPPPSLARYTIIRGWKCYFGCLCDSSTGE
jgi:hypothetical protein